MLSLEQFALFAGTAMLLVLTPGPDFIYVLTRGLTQGRAAGMAAALGFALGNFVHTFFVVIGLAALLASSEVLFWAVKIAGALYLLYIGIITFRTKTIEKPTGDKATKTKWLIFKQSVLANILNPKVAVFFVALLPQFVSTKKGHETIQVIALGTVFVVCAFVGFSVVALVSGSLNRLLLRRPALPKYMNRVAGVVLMGLGLALVFAVRG